MPAPSIEVYTRWSIRPRRTYAQFWPTIELMHAHLAKNADDTAQQIAAALSFALLNRHNLVGKLIAIVTSSVFTIADILTFFVPFPSYLRLTPRRHVVIAWLIFRFSILGAPPARKPWVCLTIFYANGAAPSRLAAGTMSHAIYLAEQLSSQPSCASVAIEVRDFESPEEFIIWTHTGS